MEEGDPRPRRGRPARREPAEPVGLRLPRHMRDELALAVALERSRSVQQLLEHVIGTYLAELRADPKYAAAFAVLDETDPTAALPANVRPIKKSR